MVIVLQECPRRWKKGCYPRHCDQPGQPQPQPQPQPQGQPGKPNQNTQPTTQPTQPAQPSQSDAIHNVVYLVDEHDVSSNTNQQVVRNGPTIIKRWAWHHSRVNLLTMNVPEVPDTIELHEMISNPAKNKTFKWEGYMFDVPGGNAALRVGIVEGADKAGNATLTGPGGNDGSQIDRVVGFAGVYPDNNVPLGPIVQVRRDDAYRLLGASYNQPNLPKVQWRCAYYITKETPKQPTPPVQIGGFRGTFSLMGEGNPDEPPPSADAGQSGETPLNYDQLMDQNLPDNLAIAGKETWGGMVFGFDFDQNVQPTPEDDMTALAPYSDSAIEELENK